MAENVTEALPKAYVLLLNWHGWKDSIECMESVLRQEYPNFQIILCDNGSRDCSLERIRSWAAGEDVLPLDGATSPGEPDTPPVPKPVRYVEYGRADGEAGGSEADAEAQIILIRNEENLGFAGGNNVGLRYAMSRQDAGFVWVLNNDTVVDRHALASMVRYAVRNPDVGMVGSKILYYDEPGTIQAMGGGQVVKWNGTSRLSRRDIRDGEEGPGPGRLDYITGASLLVRSEVLQAVGGIDERYFIYSEEVDWCLRARRVGWKPAYCPESRIWHKEGKTVGFRSAFHDYFTTRNALLLVRTFYPAFLPIALVYSLYRCAMPKVVRRQPSRLRAVLIAYRDFFTGQFNIGTANVVKPRG